MHETPVRMQLPSKALVLLCVCMGLGFSLQQVVIGHGLGMNLSLGSMLLRGFVLITTLWMFWHHRVPWVLRGPGAAIALCLVALAASMLASDHRAIALPFGSRYALELLLLWCLLNLSVAFPTFARAAARATLYILWIGVFLAVSLQLDTPGTRSLSLLFFPQETLDQYWPRASGLYSHPALFGATAVMTLAMTLQLCKEGLYGRRSVAWAIAGCLIALLLSGARNPLLGLLVVAAAGLWHLRGNRPIRMMALLAFVTLLILIAVAVVSRYGELTSATQESLFSAFSLGRPHIWLAAWKAWQSAPWFGLGPSVFQFVIPDFAEGRFLRGELHAHNVLLGLLSELGLLGTLSFVALAFALWQPWLRRRAAGRGQALAALLILLSFGLFDYYQPFYGFALHGAVMVGLLYASHVKPLPNPTAASARLSRRLAHALAFGVDKRGFPFMVMGSRTPMGRVRRAARLGFFAHRPRWQRWTLRAIMTLTWPMGALRETLRHLPEKTGRGNWALLQQGWQMWCLAMLHNVPPLEFKLYRLGDKARRATAGDYLYWPEVEVLRLLSARRKANSADVQDKARFADICQRHELPCIPTLAVFQQGRQTVPVTPFVPHQPQLWVKDLWGSQGSGAQAWLREEAGYRDSHGLFLQPGALVKHWRQRDCLIQPWLVNHPALEALSLGPLVTLRIVTGISPGGQVQLIAHLLMLFDDGRHGRPRPILCAVDKYSGQITRSIIATGEPVSEHPLTGRSVVGIGIPHWSACIDLVSRAHASAFRDFAFLGWDVAVTTDGPLLIESNAGWGSLYHQVVDDQGIGQRAFTDIALSNLEPSRCA